MLRHLRAAVVALAAAFVVAGCTYVEPPTAPTGAPATVAPTSSLDSCTVLSVGEVSKALGQTVAPGVTGKASVEGGVACVFYGPSVGPGANPDVPTPDSVRIVLVQGASAQKWYADYLSKVDPVTLKGLGDDAYYDGSASVNALKGGAYLRLSVITTTGSDEKAEIALAKIALARL